MLIEKMFCWKKDYGIKKKISFFIVNLYSVYNQKEIVLKGKSIFFSVLLKKKKRLKKHYFKIPFSYF